MTLKPINRARKFQTKVVWEKPTWDFDASVSIRDIRKILDDIEAEHGSEVTLNFEQAPYSDNVEVQFTKVVPESDEAYERRMRKAEASREKTRIRLQREIEKKQAQLEKLSKDD